MFKRFISIVGVKNYFGSEVFEIGQFLKLEKDFGNRYDEEAIRVELENLGIVGYVANSTYTVARGTRSAGRIYDSFDKVIYCRVLFIIKDTIIAEILEGNINISNISLIIEEGIKFSDSID